MCGRLLHHLRLQKGKGERKLPKQAVALSSRQFGEGVGVRSCFLHGRTVGRIESWRLAGAASGPIDARIYPDL